MKLCILLSTIVAVAYAQIDCQACQDGVLKLGALLTTPEALAQESELLKAALCAALTDPAYCSNSIDKYWEGIMAAVFAYPQTAIDICTAGGICKRQTKAMDCATCEASILKLSELFADKDFITNVIGKLSGSLFCDTVEDPVDCKAFVENFGPLAMPAVAEILLSNDSKLCTDLGCSQ